jgi:hypothetical protein
MAKKDTNPLTKLPVEQLLCSSPPKPVSTPRFPKK